MKLILALVLFFCFEIATVFATEIQCDNGLFNVCELRQPANNGYTLTMGSYEYTTNVAAILERSVDECPGISNHSVAIQKFTGRHQCYSLAEAPLQSFSLINNEDATKGVKFLYRGGVEGRSVTVTIPCDPKATSTPALKRISEPYRLNYDFEFYPIKAGCPIVTSASLPYSKDLTIAPSKFQVFRFSVDSTMVSLKVDISFAVGDSLDLRNTEEEHRMAKRAYEFLGSDVYLYTKRGAIPTFNSYEFMTFISKNSPNPPKRSLLIRGNPYLERGDVYFAIYGGNRLSEKSTVSLDVVPQNCLNCNARGTLDCDAQVCHCESPYVYKDCSGELRNITSGSPLTSEKVPSSFWKVYQLERKSQEIYLTVIVESNQNEAPVVLVGQGSLPTIDNFLASDGYDRRSRASVNENTYRINNVKERHLNIEVTEESDTLIYIAVYGGKLINEDSDGGVVDRTQTTNIQYSIVVEAYSCKNNCTSSTAGRCNPSTHKCHCHSGYAGKSCSINTKLLSVGSEKIFDIKPGAVEYFEYSTKSDTFFNVSITSRDTNKPLEDVMLYVGDGYVPDLNRYLVSSRSLKVDEEFIGEIEVEEGDEEPQDGTTTGGADTLEDLTYSVQIPPRKTRVKYFIGVLNRDPIPHTMALTINTIDYKGGLSHAGVFFMIVIMLSVGIASGIAMTLYREPILLKIAAVAAKFRIRIPYVTPTPNFTPSTRYANFSQPQQQQQHEDDDNLIFSTDDAEDPTFDE